jgi:hypothetical protein
MFGLFRSRKYRRTTVPEMRGEDHGIQILIRNFPVRVSEDLPEKRIEYYRDFNTRLMDAIWKAMGDFDSFVAQALAGPVSLDVSVKDAPAFRCEVSLKERRSKRQLYGQLPDAVIRALESANMGR